ncbi:MAG: nuclear transport factor 2 family protein [Novosphingobium sp.]
MTLDELLAREGIRDTLAKYNVSGDRLRIDDYVSCFTEDGIMEADHPDPAFAFRYAGRAAIRAWQQRWLDQTMSGERVHRASFARHHLSTCKIDLLASGGSGPDGAQVRTYWVAWTDVGPDHAGYYLDTFRKVGSDWLIAHRRVREDWRSPGSLFGNPIAETRG